MTASTNVSVRVENHAPAHGAATLVGAGSGLVGLRERVQALGGHFSAGSTDGGGWLVEARFAQPDGARGDRAASA